MTAPVRQLIADCRAALIAAAIADPKTNASLDGDQYQIEYLPRFTPEDLVDLRIVLAPRQANSTNLSRLRREHELAVQVAVMQIASKDSERFEQLLDLTDAIDAALAAADIVSGTWSRSEINLYDVQALEQHGVFRSIITAYFKHRS
jgi:hypothetical protein